MFEQFLHSYVECALWTVGMSHRQLTKLAYARMVSDARQFWGTYHDLIECNPQQAGHDFWLTRNREGSGFWDGNWPEEKAKILTEAAHKFGELSLYLSKGKVEVS